MAGPALPDRPERLAALDLIRGVAILGILPVNIAGFAGPAAALLTPHLPLPASRADEAAFAFVLLMFEGKMRTLFAILFGAGMALFIDRAEAAGREGDVLQMRRLAWLLLFGLLHYFLFWWGDILFLYALAGILALFMRELPARAMVLSALLLFCGWHLAGAIETLPGIASEERVRIGRGSPADIEEVASFNALVRERAQVAMAETRAGMGEQIARKLREGPFQPLLLALPNIPEVLSLLLLGMALYRSGFFAGNWPRKRLRGLAGAGLLAGGGGTLAALGWLWPRHFPLRAMADGLQFGLALPHLAMALGYAALLVMAAPWLAGTRPGQRIVAAGRMAFTNYIATTVVMTAIFHGWGLGLGGTRGEAGLAPFVLSGWLLMLGWSKPWLARFRQGPLEWLWRSLTEGRALPFVRRTS